MEPDPSPAPRQGVLRLFGKLGLLALFFAVLGWIGVALLAPSIEGVARQQELFGEAPPPFGLTFHSALRVSAKETLTRFVRSSGEQGPTEVLFLDYGQRASVDALLSAAPSGQGPMEPMSGMEDPAGGTAQRMREWEADPSFDWSAVLKRSDITWGKWSTKFLIERSFRKGGDWNDEARVDLSSTQRFLVLSARFAPKIPAEETVLRQLLEALRLTPDPEPGG